jgi:hypothetical protein
LKIAEDPYLLQEILVEELGFAEALAQIEGEK